ncbi:MAG: GNAT family N-acetyltransferase [Pelobacteraceae bacterium]
MKTTAPRHIESLNADSASLKTTRICSLSELDVSLDSWRVLANGAPMQSPEWLLAWWQCYSGPDDELSVLLFHEPEGLLAGLAPLYIRIAEKRRTVCLLGSGDASTNHTTWLSAAGWEERVSHAVAQFLLGSESGWDCVQFDSVDTGDVSINATAAYMADWGFPVHRRPLHNCWKIVLPSTWEEYLMMLSRSHRKQCRSLQQRYLESGLVKLHTVTDSTYFQRGFEILLQLHSARWGESDKPLGCFSDQRFRRFHETAARELLLHNQLLLVWLEYEGRPIAVEYQFIGNTSVYSYLSGMDPSVTGFSPGNLSILAAIQRAIAQGCETFDLSRGDQPYKAHWRAAPSACHEVSIWPNNPSGRLAHAMRSMRTLSECCRKRVVKGVKTLVSQRVIDTYRQIHSVMPGKRRGPNRVGSSKQDSGGRS